jgi:hypothetical protein
MNGGLEPAMLFFDKEPVAVLSDLFQHQGTWFADYRLVPTLTDEILKFVEFSRVHLSSGEFDEKTLQSFEKIYEIDLWTVQACGGEQKIIGAPLFRETDLSWVV